MYELIPEKYKAIIGMIVSVVVGVLAIAGEWVDLGPEWVKWTGRSFALIVVVSNILGLRIANPKAVKPNA